MIAEYLVGCLLILIYLNSVNGATELECGPYQCVGQQVQYQCNVTGVTTMNWRIVNDSITLEDQSYNIGSTPSSTADMFGDAPEFSTVLSSVSSSPQLIMSSIIFTGQTNINGYTIECDALGGDKEICPIVIPGIPSSPNNVTIHTDTFTNSSVNISWTKSSSPCVTGYRYNISLSSLEENIIMESTSNSVMVEGLVPSDDQYCVVVTAIDTGDRTSNGSDPVCFIFDVPNMVNELMIFNDTELNSDNTIEVSIQWEEPKFNVSGSVTVPVITRYEISLVNTTDSDSVNMTLLLNASSLEHTFTGVPTGRTYTITVTAINGVGKSLPIIEYLDAPGPFYSLIPTTTSTQSIMRTVTSTTTSTSSFTLVVPGTPPAITSTTNQPPIPTDTTLTSSTTDITRTPVIGSSNSVAIAVGVVVAVIAIILIAVVVVLLVVFLIYKKNQRESVDFKLNTKGGDNGIQLTEANPDVGKPLYGNDSPDGGATSNLPTYQDPSTIEREQGPSGDLYALPEKNTKPQPTPTAVGGEYAELDLTNKSSVKASDVPGPTTTTEDPGSVVYSDVRPHQ